MVAFVRGVINWGKEAEEGCFWSSRVFPKVYVCVSDRYLCMCGCKAYLNQWNRLSPGSVEVVRFFAFAQSFFDDDDY